MCPRFIKVKKANRNHDRGFISVDAICSVFEDKEHRIVNIMTMDGFWYEVEDDVEALYSLIAGQQQDKNQEEVRPSFPKKEFYRRKKMLAPAVGSEKMQVNQDNVCSENRKDNSEDDLDVFHPRLVKWEKRKTDVRKHQKNLPSGEGEGHCDLNPKVERPPEGEGL